MVVGEASIHNIMGGMESTGGVRLHNHKRKLKQRFDIIKKLGQGTYGKVQLGINKETGQEVAIKTIKKCKIETEADLIRIRREIQIMSSVQHPNIIHIYEVFENREKMVLVMEYAAGGELYDYLSERKVLSEQEARRIFRQIATAVFYCHKHKICHRDLKLENILLDQIGNAKIADFGLSNVFDGQRLLNTFCGSPLYASPEIVKGTPYHGPEVDCWSLGVLLYTLVYGAMPFDGSNFKRLVKQISQSDYFEPKKPSPASPLIKDMLTVHPRQRADIEKICTHWWVNEGYEQNCLDIAEDLAAQTPVRLDLLLSIVPQSASAEKLVVGDQQTSGEATNNMSSETIVPTRCHSVGSFMELDPSGSEIRRSLFEDELRDRTPDAKRKLETTPSMDETAAAGAKRKESSCRQEAAATVNEEREARAYKSTSRHHTAPIPSSIIEEAMDIGPLTTVPSISIRETAELNKTEAAESSLESPKDNQSQVDKLQENEKSVDKGKKTVSKCINIAADVKEDIDINTSAADNNNISLNNLSNIDIPTNEIKKVKEKSVSMDVEPPTKPMERRRSKIFETAEKFNQIASSSEPEKPKKIFIPGVNVGGAKRAFERKASLSSITPLPTVKANTSKVIIDVPQDKKQEKNEGQEGHDESKKEDAKKRAVDIISGAIGKPPVQKKINGSPPVTPQTQDTKKLGLKIQIAPNDIRNATISVSTPVTTKFQFEEKTAAPEATISSTIENENNNVPEDEPKMSSKMEITLKSATLPRQRKTSKAEITLSGVKPFESPAFKSEVEAKIDAFQPQKLRTQRSEIAFPVAAAVPQAHRSSSLEPEGRMRAAVPKERIIPIHVEPGHEPQQPAHTTTPPPKPPMTQRSMSQRSSSLSRQSTAESDTDTTLGSTSAGPEPIRKSPREYIIPIAVEGGGYVTPRSGSVEPESNASTPTSSTTATSRPRFPRPRRMSSLLSDASEDESPFSTLHRDSEDLLQRHMHRLRSSRPLRQPAEHADSLSSGEEDDDDDGFELLTAENLFSTLLSRVRSLTQRLNVDENRTAGFPTSRLLGRLGSNSPQTFWGMNKPLSRLSESPFKHSFSRDSDIFSRKDSANSTNPASPNSPGTASRSSVFDIGSNTLPRDKIEDEDVEAEKAQMRREAEETLQQSFTPSLARRLSRQFIEQTRQSLPRSPSMPREKLYSASSSSRDSSLSLDHQNSSSTIMEQQPVFRSRSIERRIRRANSLLEPSTRSSSCEYRSPKRSISLFDDDDYHHHHLLPYTPRQVMTLGRKYKDPEQRSFHSYRTEKIQEEPADDNLGKDRNDNDNQENSISEYTSVSVCNSTTNLGDTSSISKSYETSPTDSCSNMTDGKYYKKDCTRNFENRLLAAENLIKESKLKNLGTQKFNPNLNCNYQDNEKCDKESLDVISESSAIGKRRGSCIPSLRLRSGSLGREASSSLGSADRRKSYAASQDALSMRISPERSILSKFFRPSGSKDSEPRERASKDKPKQRRISRFLRPDFFDTPREESKYVKEKEAQKAAENERRKSRFMKKKTDDNKINSEVSVCAERPEKELKNVANNRLRKDKSDTSSSEDKSKRDVGQVIETQSSKSSFLHSLEKKLEKFRSNEEQAKQQSIANGCGASVEPNIRFSLRESSAPPVNNPGTESKENIKRATSVEDISAKAPPNSPKSRVSTVLGLFKNESKQNATNGKSPSAILSRLKKSPTKSVKTEEEAPSSSKIPTKLSKTDSKVIKRRMDAKNSTDKPVVIDKKSPTAKEKPQKVSLDKKQVEKTVKKKNISASEEPEKKTKKVPRTKGSTEKEEDADGTKKKRIVRAVKRVVKKSSDTSSDSKSEEASGSKEAGTSKDQDKEKEKPAKSNERKQSNGQNLKLDLSKIPQKTSRNVTPKREIRPRSSESPKKPIERNNDESIESSSKVAMKQPQNSNVHPPKSPTPVEETESFDSWSICSADYGQHRSEQTSPTQGQFTNPAGTSLESVIDRIRRKSFYSRFNDRKRASLTAPPPGVSLPSSSFSRKYSLNSPRESNYKRSNGDRGRYSDNVTTPYSSTETSSYDPTFRYLRSPTFDSNTRRRYQQHGNEVYSDDLGSFCYRSSLLNGTDPYSCRTLAATLPRKFTSTVSSSGSDPKSVQYFQELLAPLSNERRENGYHSESLAGDFQGDQLIRSVRRFTDTQDTDPSTAD